MDHQGCQMVYFQTKNSTLGKFWCVMQRKMLVNFMTIILVYYTIIIVYYTIIIVYYTAILYIFRLFSIFVVILVHFSRFGMLYQEKSGNSDQPELLAVIGC
jgi:hypothetical protein